MNMHRVFFTETLFPDTGIEERILAEAGVSLTVGTCRTEDDIIRQASDCDAMATFVFKPVSARVLSSLKMCRIVVRGGIGVDTIDVPAATSCGIIATNIPHYSLDEVPDLSVALMLALLRKPPAAISATRRGEWNRDVVKPLRSLNRLTVGIVGFGNIGRRSARRAAASGMRILFCDPAVPGDVAVGECIARKADLEALSRQADVIFLHAPSTPETYHLINRDTLHKAKDGCILINTARGQLVDTDALVEALRSGRVAGAGLDLVENVPPLPEGHPLTSMENVILTPYCAWYTEDSVALLRETTAREIARVLKGFHPRSIVNPEVKGHERAAHLKEEPCDS